jgi:DNA-binding NarL/FixJ family response regulator
MPTIKILLADDHAVVADSLSMMLETEGDFQMLGTVNNGWQALNFIEKTEVDIMLLDYHMPLLNGVETVMKLKETGAKTKAIILSMSEESEHIKDSIQAGVKAYVLKSAERAELIKAIKLM